MKPPPIEYHVPVRGSPATSSAAERERVRVERQLLQRVEPDVGRRRKVDRVASTDLDSMRVGNPAHGSLQIGRVARLGIESEQAGLHSKVGAVPMPRFGERAIEIDPNARHVPEIVGRIEVRHERERGAPRAEGVRAGGPDAHFEHVEDRKPL